MFSSTADTSNTVQTTNTGTTTKYNYSGFSLVVQHQDITTPAAVATTGTYYIRREFATDALP
jgi:hypothetical protein